MSFGRAGFQKVKPTRHKPAEPTSASTFKATAPGLQRLRHIRGYPPAAMLMNPRN